MKGFWKVMRICGRKGREGLLLIDFDVYITLDWCVVLQDQRRRAKKSSFSRLWQGTILSLLNPIKKKEKRRRRRKRAVIDCAYYVLYGWFLCCCSLASYILLTLKKKKSWGQCFFSCFLLPLLLLAKCPAASIRPSILTIERIRDGTDWNIDYEPAMYCIVA